MLLNCESQRTKLETADFQPREAECAWTPFHWSTKILARGKASDVVVQLPKFPRSLQFNNSFFRLFLVSSHNANSFDQTPMWS